MEAQPLVLCDTNILIEFYKAKPATLNQLQQIGQSRIAVSVVTSGELIYGALNRHELNQIKKDMKHLKMLHINKGIGDIFLEIIAKYSLRNDNQIKYQFWPALLADRRPADRRPAQCCIAKISCSSGYRNAGPPECRDTSILALCLALK